MDPAASIEVARTVGADPLVNVCGQAAMRLAQLRFAQPQPKFDVCWLEAVSKLANA
jgi:hypothetical protein